jgi:predicted MPP superfamily phosphohydrolase
LTATETLAEAEKSATKRNQAQWNMLIIIALVLHVPFFFYPILRLCSWLDISWWLTILVFIPLASSQIVSRLLLRHSQEVWAKNYRKTADFWMGLTPVLLISLLIFEIIVSISDLSTRVAGLSVIGLTIVGGFVGLIVAITPRVKKIVLHSKKISTPLRFVQITDVHIGSRSKMFLERVIFSVNRLNPDFLCITGDFIDATNVPESDLCSLKSLSCPIYFCLGNHEKYEDLEQIIQRLKNLGVHVLQSDALHFRDDVQILGIDDMEDSLQVEKELPNIQLDADALKILLYHRPQGLEAARDAGIDLTLSGHTHNGQIFPFNFAVNRVFNRTKGMYQLGDARQYVSQGTGTWGPVMRLGTTSEITLFNYLPE